jgi:hypothetical protein
MAVHPLPPYPHAPAPAGVTPRRLWFLLAAAAGFTRAQAAELTGVTADDVIDLQHETFLWRGDHEPLVPGVADRVVLLRVCDHVHVQLERRTVSTTVLRRALRDAFVAGEIPRELVDALPEPAFIARLVGR